MNPIRKYIERQRRKRLVMHTNFTIAETPLVHRWINGDDSVVEELRASWEERSRYGAY